ncbi:Uma2 family endonuclease [Tautonia rosea]|uniref:Uma2 family endonuclease n=1 Tax=Tautonia rosea TaxID=2728037 RepID=UPI001475D916|nr:Uma2 family endonuclease [Tautonia rosea]
MSTQRTSLLLGPDDDGRFVSAEEFAEAEFVEPWTYEREAGRLVVVSPEGQRHLDDSKPWRQRLSRYWIEHPDVVEELAVQAWVRVDDGTDRIGDIGVYLVTAPGRSVPPIPERVPDLMFEIVSPGRTSRQRDYVTKRREYFQLGIREYVVIDPLRQAVTIFIRGPRGDRRRTLRRGHVYQSPMLPGLVVPIDEVF